MSEPFLPPVPVQARKGVEYLLRVIGQAPEQRGARRLRRRIDDLPVSDEPGSGKRVMIMSPRDWSSVVQYDSMIGHGLALRGADVSFLTCGGGLEICDRANTHEAPPMPCTSCARYTSVALDAHGFETHMLSTYWNDDDEGEWPEIDELEAGELRGAEAEGLPLGELVSRPVKWFLCAANLDDDPLAGPTNRAFLRSARRIARAVDKVLDEVQPDHVLMFNGFFLFEAILWARCRQRGIDVVTYERAFRKETLVVHREVPAGLYDFSDSWPQSNRPLTDAETVELDTYLDDRRKGTAFDQRWIWEDRAIERPEGRLAVMFTNLTWDTAVIERDDAFPSIEAWVDSTIDYFVRRPDDHLVIRIHPAETSLPSQRTRDSLFDYINRAHPDLPKNITVIAPGDAVTSYQLMDQCDLGLVYTSTTGLELALNGKPVITSGETHYRRKGFTEDVSSPDDYWDALDRALAEPGSLPQDREMARRYTHFFFFRAPVPSPGVLEPIKGLARLATEDPADLMPNGLEGVDRICRGILEGTPFVKAG